MPNWVSADVELIGKKKDLDDFVAKAKGYYPEYIDGNNRKDGRDFSYFCFNNYIPIPREVLSNGYNKINAKKDGGYEWQINNWGSKWHPEFKKPLSPQIERAKKVGDLYKLCLSFETAWSPIFPVFNAVSAAHPGLRITYAFRDEMGNVEGDAEWKGGKMLYEDFRDYPAEEEE